MAINLFTFPPDEGFDEEWRETLNYIQRLELTPVSPSHSIAALGFVSDILKQYEQELVEHHPLYTEYAERISELANLAMRATNSFAN